MEIRSQLPFGKRLREARESKGLTQKEFAELLGISASTLSKYENSMQSPSAEMLGKMSVILGITMNKLTMGFDDPMRGKSFVMRNKDN